MQMVYERSQSTTKLSYIRTLQLGWDTVYNKPASHETSVTSSITSHDNSKHRAD